MTRKKPRFVDFLVGLPKEVIGSIFSYIPDSFLHTYIDNPLIGEHALEALLSNITICDPRYYMDNRHLHIPIGDEFLCEERFQITHDYEVKDVNQFLEIMKKHPNIKPKYITVNNLEEVSKIHKENPSFLEGTSIRVNGVHDVPLTKEVFKLPYKFHKLFVGNPKYDIEIPESTEELQAPVEVLDRFSSQLMNIKRLKILNFCSIENLDWLPPNLSSLDLKFICNDNTQFKLDLFTSLKSLTLRVSKLGADKAIDLSHLQNLKKFSGFGFP